MPEAANCASCGAPWLAGAQFCYSCGKSPTPAWPGVAAPPPVQPPAGSPFGVPPAAVAPAVVPVKPFGIVALTVVEIVIAAVGVWVAIDFLQWVNYGINYQDTGEVPLDLAFGVAYLATSAVMFGVARGLWSTQSWAWTRACLLNIALLGMIVVSVVPWGLNMLDIVGIAANGSMLAYLSLTPTRRLFGLAPLAFMEVAR